MTSKGVVDRVKAAEVLRVTAEMHLDTIGDRMTELLEPFARRGDPIPDLGVAVALMGRRLKSLGEAMLAADRSLAMAESGSRDAERIRAKRDAAVAAYDAAFADTTVLVTTLLHVAGVEPSAHARAS